MFADAADTEYRSAPDVAGPTNPNLEVLQTSEEAALQMKRIQITCPRKTAVGKETIKGLDEDDREYQMEYAFVTQTGYYPEDLKKANQDSVSLHVPFQEGKDPNNPLSGASYLFGVFDGHGKLGAACSQFVMDRLPQYMTKSEGFDNDDFDQIFNDAFVATNEEMHAQERYGRFSDMMSGTTAITAYIKGRTLHVANVGDSRAIMGVDDGQGLIKAEPLSIDQTPFRSDERDRVKLKGARVLTMDQIEGYRDPNDQNFGSEEEDDGDPPRLWCADGAYPGTAFTRSIGDQIAERIGVYAQPEQVTRELTPDDAFVLIASDGVFEFLSSQAVVDIVVKYKDPLEACRAVVAESYRLWLQYEVRTDDISCIMVRFSGLAAPKCRLQTQPSDFSKWVLNMGEMRPVRRNLTRVKQAAIGNVTMDPNELAGYELPFYKKSVEERGLIKAAVRANFLFRHLNEEQLEKAVNAMETLDVEKGQIVIKQFDEGDRFYLIANGSFDVEVAVPKTITDEEGKTHSVSGEYEPPMRVFTYDSGHGTNPCFGELALMYSQPRAATVKASGPGRLWALERNAFRTILMKTPARMLTGILRRVEILKPLSQRELKRMADLMTEEAFVQGEHIVRQGDVGDVFYIITEGQAIVTINKDEGVSEQVMQLNQYMYFGERALLHDAPRGM